MEYNTDTYSMCKSQESFMNVSLSVKNSPNVFGVEFVARFWDRIVRCVLANNREVMVAMQFQKSAKIPRWQSCSANTAVLSLMSLLMTSCPINISESNLVNVLRIGYQWMGPCALSAHAFPFRQETVKCDQRITKIDKNGSETDFANWFFLSIQPPRCTHRRCLVFSPKAEQVFPDSCSPFGRQNLIVSDRKWKLFCAKRVVGC